MVQEGRRLPTLRSDAPESEDVIMFVQFDCGCIGIPLAEPGVSLNVKATAIIIRACDEERDTPRDSLSWAGRDMTGKAWEPLSEFKRNQFHDRLAERFARADRFDEVKRALEG